MTLSDLLGATSSVTFEGKTYALRKPQLDEQARFSRRLEDRALAAIGRQTRMPEDERDRQTRLVFRDIATGQYEIDSPAYVEALHTPDGMAHMLFLILSADHPEVTEARAREIVERNLREVAAVIIREGHQDPKLVAQVLAVLGLPPDFFRSGSDSSSSGSPTPPSTGGPGTSAG